MKNKYKKNDPTPTSGERGGGAQGPGGKAGTNTTRTLYVLLRGCVGGVAGDFVFLPTCGVEG